MKTPNGLIELFSFSTKSYEKEQAETNPSTTGRSTFKYERIRKALAMAPTPGPWAVDRLSGSGRLQVNGPSSHTVAASCHNVYIPEEAHAANAHPIAASDPATTRALAADRDEPQSSD